MPVTAPDNYYQYPGAVGYPNQPPQDRTENHKLLASEGFHAFGFNRAQAKILQQYRISILCGEIGKVFATTSTHKIYYFQSDDLTDRQLLLKLKSPLNSEAETNVPMRNILCQLFARELGMEYLLPEYSLNSANNQPGTVMTEIKGKTVHQWLIDEGYLNHAAQLSGVNNKQLAEFMALTQPYNDDTFARLMRTAFTKAIDKNGLLQNWREIAFLDFLTGQADRANLKNMIITRNANGYLKLIAIDNDMTFPVQNNPLMVQYPPGPHSAYSMPQVEQLCTTLLTITGKMLPEAKPALQERVQRFIDCYYWHEIDATSECSTIRSNGTEGKSLELIYLQLPTITPLYARFCQSIYHALRRLIPCSRLGHGASSESL